MFFPLTQEGAHSAPPCCGWQPETACGRLISPVLLQRTYRMPKEIRVEPQKFAAELIHRLEAIQRTREAEEKLEERLRRVRMVSGPHISRYQSSYPCG